MQLVSVEPGAERRVFRSLVVQTDQLLVGCSLEVGPVLCHTRASDDTKRVSRGVWHLPGTLDGMRWLGLGLTIAGYVVIVGAAVWLRRRSYDFTVGFNGQNWGVEQLVRDSNAYVGVTLAGANLQVVGAVLTTIG